LHESIDKNSLIIFSILYLSVKLNSYADKEKAKFALG